MKPEILHEANYATEMTMLAEPYLASLRKTGYFEREPGKRLYYETFCPPSPKGWIMVCHGFTEFITKYNEVIYSFLKAGYGVAMPEHQGHGRSYRRVEELWLTHVEDFEDYVKDFACFLETVTLPLTDGLPVYLFGHSMGGAISARLLEEYPGFPIRRAALSSPMIAASTQNIPKSVAMLICRAAILFGKGDRVLVGQKPFTGEDDFASPLCCAKSRARYDWTLRRSISYPQFQNSAPSFRWLLESLRITDPILEDAGNISVPVLLCQAGKDTMVYLPPQDDFVSRLPDGRKVVFPEARHETFRCDDETVERFLSTILTFFETGEA